MEPSSPDRVNVLNLLVDAKQPSSAKLPMVAGSLSGTKLSVGEGEDDTGVVGATPPDGLPDGPPDGMPDGTPDGPGPPDGTLEGKVFPEGTTEPPDPEGTRVGAEPPSEAPLDPEGPGGGTTVSTGPEAELAPEAGGVAIGVGTTAEVGKPGLPLVAGRPGVVEGNTKPWLYTSM